MLLLWQQPMHGVPDDQQVDRLQQVGVARETPFEFD